MIPAFTSGLTNTRAANVVHRLLFRLPSGNRAESHPVPATCAVTIYTTYR
jgi:hypothetical protein